MQSSTLIQMTNHQNQSNDSGVIASQTDKYLQNWQIQINQLNHFLHVDLWRQSIKFSVPILVRLILISYFWSKCYKRVVLWPVVVERLPKQVFLKSCSFEFLSPVYRLTIKWLTLYVFLLNYCTFDPNLIFELINSD